MTARTTVTFLGPVTKVPLPNRVTNYAFHVLQPGGGVTLTFTDRPTALKERNRLAGLPNSHRVQSKKLMKAIQQAMEASSKGSHRPKPV